MATQQENQPNSQRMIVKPGEPEFEGSIWKHPYFIYIYLTAALALFLAFIGWMALENGWIPNRGL